MIPRARTGAPTATARQSNGSTNRSGILTATARRRPRGVTPTRGPPEGDRRQAATLITNKLTCFLAERFRGPRFGEILIGGADAPQASSPRRARAAIKRLIGGSRDQCPTVHREPGRGCLEAQAEPSPVRRQTQPQRSRCTDRPHFLIKGVYTSPRARGVPKKRVRPLRSAPASRVEA